MSFLQASRGKGVSSTAAAKGGDKKCAKCLTVKTPQWRRGLNRVRLCNACGVRYDKSLKKTLYNNPDDAAAGPGASGGTTDPAGSAGEIGEAKD
jgi:hypothetical protein